MPFIFMLALWAIGGWAVGEGFNIPFWPESGWIALIIFLGWFFWMIYFG